jgi:hypothetical protein
MNRASYIGGNIGGPATFGSPDSGNASGILGGGQIGFGGPTGAMGY